MIRGHVISTMRKVVVIGDVHKSVEQGEHVWENDGISRQNASVANILRIMFPCRSLIVNKTIRGIILLVPNVSPPCGLEGRVGSLITYRHVSALLRTVNKQSLARQADSRPTATLFLVWRNQRDTFFGRPRTTSLLCSSAERGRPCDKVARPTFDGEATWEG
jgi:hypothetical protein